MLALQVIWNPEEVKPPDRVCKKFSRCECPGFPVSHKLCPAHFACRCYRVALDVSQLFCRASRVVLRAAVEKKPQHEPGEADASREEKGPAPTPVHRDPRSKH